MLTYGKTHVPFEQEVGEPQSRCEHSGKEKSAFQTGIEPKLSGYQACNLATIMCYHAHT
jgi:hypothetical protein